MFQKGKRRTETINLPVKHHQQSNRYKTWNRRKTIQIEQKLGKYYLVYFWEKEKTPQKQIINSVGIDIGYNKLISDSNGVHYGKNLKTIYDRISKKQRGSKAYERLLRYKTNETNRVVNQFIRTNNPDEVICENLCNVKKSSKLYKSINNKLQYWSYRQVLDKLERLSEIEGFKITKVEPSYTSQTCCKCGVINKSNRQGEIYKCTCGNLIDADTNAAINILHKGKSLPLP